MDAYTAGSYARAEEEFRAAVYVDPGMADAWLGLHALRSDTAGALLAMQRHRERFGEQRERHRRPLSSWYWLGWWVQPVLETPQDLALAHASHWLDGRHLAELDQALTECPAPEQEPAVRFLHACRSYLMKDWEQLIRDTDRLLDDPVLGIEAGLFAGMARVRLDMCAQAQRPLASSLARCRSEQPQRKELRYWLGRAYEGAGRSAAALPLYRAVHRADPAFMDTAQRLAAISAEDGLLDGEAYGEYRGTLEELPVDEPPGPDGAEPDGGAEPERAQPAGEAHAGQLAERAAGASPLPLRLGNWAAAAAIPAAGPNPAPAARLELDQALAELEAMVGLDPVKRQVRALSAQLRMARLRADRGLPVQPPKRHFVFSGPSGTGKTTVARILGRVFHALGLLSGDHLVEAQRADLVGEFLGQTAVKANELIDSALDGVLFIDEAYSLANSGYSKGDAYGDEALQVLLKRAEDNRDRLVVILAGYPEGMNRLLATNPGLNSRFTTRVDFPSYRPAELSDIGLQLAQADGDGWDVDAAEELASICAHVVAEGWIDQLGNGRFVRTLYEKSCAYRDLRLSGQRGVPSREDLATLRLPDLLQAYGELIDGRQ
ncbi:AAA family ATPase [Streptomyces sp. TLI_171]|uniref:AAA family ATPase n=1 Tax=Streptomyces sp. TLI_171 TaxID=1938859 RepID=UPI000C189A39|nr:AAA family ATPase [Streptomyces sp. TLI_171]